MEYRPAASVCLLHRATRSILMGKRLVGPWPGYWAFPGGKVEAGESALEAALRELEEETSVVLATSGPALSPLLQPLLRTSVKVEFGDRRYAIENFVIEVSEKLKAAESIELLPAWVELDRIGEIEPIARGTQTVIDRVLELIAPGR